MRVHSQAGSGAPVFYIFDGGTLLGEVQASGGAGSVQVVYTWGANGLLSERLFGSAGSVGVSDSGSNGSNGGDNSISSVNGGGRSLWYAFDVQGATRALTNSAGAVVDTYQYTPFGSTTLRTGSDPNPFQWGGQAGYYTDAANPTGTILCGLRWYNPSLGRWLSRDPIGYEGGPNLYAYCDNNPVMNLDPMGTEPPHPDEEPESYNLNDCADLLRYINALTQRLAERYQDLRQDPRNLRQLEQRGFINPIVGSYSGHQQRYRELQRRLRNAWQDYQDRCGKSQPKDVLRGLNRIVKDAVYLRAPERPDAGYHGSDKGLQDRSYLLMLPVIAPRLIVPALRGILSKPAAERAIEQVVEGALKKAA